MAHTEKIAILEEIANSILQGVGLLLSIMGLVSILYLRGNDWLKITSFSIFGTTLILMYLISMLYHSLIFTKAKRVFHILDYAAIFLLIAGTYTPFLLIGVKGILGLLSLIIIWLLAIIGIILKVTTVGKHRGIFLVLYLIMGWLCLIVITPLWHSITHVSFLLIILGGIWYTAGTFFFTRKNLVFNHMIWHVFVMLGTISHYFAAYNL